MNNDTLYSIGRIIMLIGGLCIGKIFNVDWYGILFTTVFLFAWLFIETKFVKGIKHE